MRMTLELSTEMSDEEILRELLKLTNLTVSDRRFSNLFAKAMKVSSDGMLKRLFEEQLRQVEEDGQVYSQTSDN